MVEIFPAIDLKDGKAVRLLKGEMQSAKIYGDCVEFAQYFESIGAKWIHIVDLDGAFKGSAQNLESIKKIRQATNLKIQLGGGIRNEDTIKMYLHLGINRIILGSMALENPEFAKQMAEKYPIAIGIDAKDGKVATQGWIEVGQTDAFALAKDFRDSGIQAIICTDIARDGALSGINVDFTLKMAEASQCFVIASGGFASIDEIKNLSKAFTQKGIQGGLIIGKAFYEGKIKLEEVFEILK
ncbi:1-(5-phosphoribosyl)-5-[(5-phosphoribosylamino)methylideneamino]imidazole-4-carboxamide isomerase [Helicobacter fennelliae]|uniref:1-(5-phosphoribosyl)-5-[(5-phosphoribosylamino)methylideneamino] imidazole-4-carboxamide isomerase n=1 Tax=Helicobacter fennelliae TaxID=215 RepID=A0A2X3B177_9HELI|nr:1-(5-phosphoribosyl)-5-[(5-phosphoribosylamino)methylideneamino]imidazole-4-carboxamide isomerase [Helicobacter fennelliae]SQB98958.1 phosphoribosylformimino-5-aminoimidazole carboxamide ribotide isomerase [Helicobacter fennelliae]